MSQLTFLLEERPANLSVSLASEEDYLISVVTSPLNFAEYLLQNSPNGLCGKMCREYSAAQAGPILKPSSLPFSNAGIVAPGVFWTHSIMECHNDADVCLLLDILETTGDHLMRYYLSEKACKGILRRAQKRGKELPERLNCILINQCQH